MTLRAPFPWFGGKSRAAGLIWPRLGDVRNYIEPFAGSLAVLLARPTPARIETVNDVDCYLANFWRALQHDPEGVAYHADSPVNETDLHARHRWLVHTAKERLERLKTDPDFYDVKVAGWWVWGQCLWIGSGWCASPEWTGRVNAGRAARGVNTERYQQRPSVTGDQGVIRTRNGDPTEQRRRPQLTGDQGVLAQKRPVLREAGADGIWKKRFEVGQNGQGSGIHRRWNGGGKGGGSGVCAPSLSQQIPQLCGDGSGAHRGLLSERVKSAGLYEYLGELAGRLRRVRVCCGDWKRVLTPAVTTYIGITGVLLDPPYSQSERSICYAHDYDISAHVRAWALEHGGDPKFRIALCGYEGEHKMPTSWSCAPWRAHGGYSRSERGRKNRDRERIWFSPHCLPAERPSLFDGEATA